MKKNNQHSQKYTIQVCHGQACTNKCSNRILERTENEIEFRKIKNAKVEQCGCLGQCKEGPNVKITNHKSNKTQILNRMNAAQMGEKVKKIGV